MNTRAQHYQYDILIIGAGLYGCTCARALTDTGKRCLIIDKLPHLGGACYSQRQDGIDIHRYGAHIFHTNIDHVLNFVSRYTPFLLYQHVVTARAQRKEYSFPLNLNTFRQLWGITTPKEAQQKLKSLRHSEISSPSTLEEWILSQVGTELYHLFYQGYTQKQWKKDPKELPASIAARIPVRYHNDDRFFTDTYQGIPQEGYSQLFHNLTTGINILLSTDFFSKRDHFMRIAPIIIYTGRIDEFFDMRFGPLEYRSLHFDTEKIDQPCYQETAVVNYCDSDIPHTRTIEHKKFATVETPHTYVTWEYPADCDPTHPPYYPIPTDTNLTLLARYQALAQQLPHIHFGGRLAEYKYYNMDSTIAAALSFVETLGDTL